MTIIMKAVSLLFVILLVVASANAQSCTHTNCTVRHVDFPSLKSGAPYSFSIGYIASSSVSTSFRSMAEWAVYFMNNDISVLPNTTIKFYSAVADSTKDVVGAVANVLPFAKAMILDLSEANTQLAANIITAVDVPVISTSSSTNVFASKQDFSYMFTRYATPDYNECIALLELCAKLNISEVSYAFSESVYGLTALSDCLQVGTTKNITVTPVQTNGNDSDIVVQTRIMNARAIYIATDPAQGVPLVQSIHKYNAYGKEYFYMLSIQMARTLQPYFLSYPFVDGSVIIVPSVYTNNAYFFKYTVGWNQANSTMFPGAKSNIFGFPTLDSTNLIANTVDSFVQEGISADAITGPQLQARILSKTHDSATGPFKFNEMGDREGFFQIYNVRIINQTAITAVIAIYDSATKLISFTNESYTYYEGSKINPVFVKRFSDLCSFSICNYRGNCSAQAACVCYPGFTGTYCEKRVSNKMATTTIVAIVVPVVVVIAVISAFAVWYVQKRRKEIVKEVKDKQRSEIPRNELKLMARIGRGAAGEVMKGVFRGTEVAVKRLLTNNASKSAIEEFSLETAIMCGLRHPNIIMFMGSCYDPIGKEFLLVMELMTRGSLHDVLHNPKVSLPIDLQVHLALQAAQGMNFLHSSKPPILHCDLKSHNILLDDKWNARISDFGITRFKEASKKGDSGSRSVSLGTIFWTSPEVLEGHAHSEQSDCYAYGMVLWEIFHRQNPYDGIDLMKVAVEVSSKQLRPAISPNCPDEIKRMIEICWHQDPKVRPSFQQIVDELRSLSNLNPLHDLGNHTSTRVQAPVGEVYFVYTEIARALTLSNSAPRAFQKAILMHNQHMRHTLESYGGYEVSCLGHYFLVSFPSLQSALNWAIAAQISLMHLPWPEEILALPLASKKTDESTGQLIWSGLRVRMAIHAGTAQTDKDSMGRLTYKGPVVDRVKKLLQETDDGSIIASTTIYEELNGKSVQLVEPIVMPCESGRTETSTYYHITPEKLTKRRGPGMERSSLSLHTLEDGIENISAEGDAQKKEEMPSWVVHWSDLTIMEGLGRGSTGDYHRALWKGKEVAVKVLVNQKLREEDIISLGADTVVLSTLNHPNILPFYGACFEEHHISLVTEYVSRGNLRVLLSDNSVAMPLAQGLKIARDIAAGMAYLASHPDPEVRIHDNFKSHNVMITKDWEAKITDYGQSNIKDLARTMTSVSNVAWTAPEILEGDPITPECALYSFGIILWEILTRKVPYEKEHPIKVVTKILAGHRPPIPADKVPPQCKELLEACWNPQGSMRPSWHVIQSELSFAIEKL